MIASPLGFLLLFCKMHKARLKTFKIVRIKALKRLAMHDIMSFNNFFFKYHHVNTGKIFCFFSPRFSTRRGFGIPRNFDLKRHNKRRLRGKTER